MKRRASKIARKISQNTAVTITAHVIPSFKNSQEFTEQDKAQEMPIKTKKAKS